MNRFINDHKDNWQRLEDLLATLETSSIKGLSRMEVREFGELYRRAATDLAIARAETRDLKLINYLNSLVIRAHGKIYRAENQGANLVWNFFAEDFPRAFRRTWRFTALAFLIFTFCGVASFLLCYNDLNFADELGLGDLRFAVQDGTRWWLELNKANQIGSSAILTNNNLVALRTFAYGASFGIGSIYYLVFNGLQIGGVLGVCYKLDANFGNDLVTFMIGHGVIELSCIFIVAGAGMFMGYSVINPGDLTRAEALKKTGLETVRLAVGCVILLVIAGIIEGFLSPSALPAWVKFGTGILTGAAMYAYLLLAGQNGANAEI
jgi:uncharacterized membrane protein SpoIIM required for sporulation